MASEQNPIIEILSWAGFAFAAFLGLWIALVEGLIKTVLGDEK